MICIRNARVEFHRNCGPGLGYLELARQVELGINTAAATENCQSATPCHRQRLCQIVRDSAVQNVYKQSGKTQLPGGKNTLGK